MTVYLRAVRQVWMMLICFLAFIPANIIGASLGFSPETILIPFALVGIWISLKNLSLRCSNCGKNVFSRGLFWSMLPNRTCGKCGLELDRDDQQLR